VNASEICGPHPSQLRSRPAAVDIAQAAEMLAGARFPLLFAGAGVAQEDALEQVVKLADLLAAPVCCENRLNLDYNPYPTEERHFVGPFQPWADFLQRADVIFAFGCRLFVEFVPPEKPWIPPEKKLIHLHPDAAEIGDLYRPEVGLCGSVRDGIEDLLTELPGWLNGREEALVDRDDEVRLLHEAFINRRTDYFQSLQTSGYLRVGAIARELAGVVDSSTTVILDSATTNDVLVEYVPRHHAKSYHTCATGGSLGWGMGAAIGVKMGTPERKVICVVGDGSFMFGAPALLTAMKYNVPVTFLLVNNSSYAAVKAGLLRYKGEAAKKGIFPGSDIGGVRYATIAEGFGIPAFQVTSEADLHRISEAIAQDDGPVLIEVVTDPDEVGRIER
jgi:benzoylformate decarboxylase